MSHTWMTLHDCTDLKVTHYQPNNANLISLTIIRSGEYASDVEISFFGLPKEITDALLTVLKHGPHVHQPHLEIARKAEEQVDG